MRTIDNVHNDNDKTDVRLVPELLMNWDINRKGTMNNFPNDKSQYRCEM